MTTDPYARYRDDVPANGDDADPFLDDEEIEVEAAPPPPDDKLRTVATLSARLLALADERLALEARLKAKTEELRQIEEVALPAALLDAGTEDFTLIGGGKVTLKTDYHASIPEAMKPAAFAWLRKRRHDAIIKHEVKVTFGKGEEKLAKRLLSSLTRRKVVPRFTDREFVEPSTLKAFVRERIAAGEIHDVDHDLFGIYVRRYAEVKLPKASRP